MKYHSNRRISIFQVENEYGSYSCDVEYMTQLRDIMRKHVGTKALLYTTDGSIESMIRCGSVEGVYATIDFGTNTNVTKNFEIMRKYQPRVSIHKQLSSNNFTEYTFTWNDRCKLQNRFLIRYLNTWIRISMLYDD